MLLDILTFKKLFLQWIQDRLCRKYLVCKLFELYESHSVLVALTDIGCFVSFVLWCYSSLQTLLYQAQAVPPFQISSPEKYFVFDVFAEVAGGGRLCVEIN